MSTMKRGKTMRSLLREPMDELRPSLFWRATSVFVIMSQLLLVDSALGQVSNPTIIVVSVAPSGSCTAPTPLRLVNPAGTLYSCQNGTYAQVGGGGGVTSVANSDGTLTISPNTGSVVASLNLATANTWTATSPTIFNGGLQVPSGKLINLTDGATAAASMQVPTPGNAQIEAYTSAAGTTALAQFIAESNGQLGGLWAGSTTNSPATTFVVGMPTGAGKGMTDSSVGDTLLATVSGKTDRLGVLGSPSTMQVSGTQVTIPSLKASSGTRFACFDTSGNLTSSVTACSGT